LVERRSPKPDVAGSSPVSPAKNMTKSFKQIVVEKEVTFTYLGTKNVPKFNKVSSVLAIPFTDDGRIVVVRLKHRGIDLPGGHVEKYETKPEETLTREVLEEACMTMKDLVLVEVISSDIYGEDDKLTYLLIYAGMVDKMYEFSADDEYSTGREIMLVEQFVKEYRGGGNVFMAQMINSAKSRIFSSTTA
jgi:hypothetical protein